MSDTLTAKLANAREAVASVGKEGRNTAQNYAYVRAEDVVRAASKALAEAGLVLTSEVVELRTERIESRSGGAGRLADVSMAYRLRNINGNGHIDFAWQGSGSDYPGDKATYKAITGAHKYFLTHLLEIATGDDPEDEPAAKPKRAAAKTAAKGSGGKVRSTPALVAKITKALGEVDVGYNRLCTLIGAAGGDAPKLNRKDSILVAINGLDKKQATELLASLEGES